MNEKEISRQITRFLKEELNNEEIDRLWEEFLKNPELFYQFETEVNLHELFRKENQNTLQPSQSRKGIVKTISRYRTWLYAAAAAVILSLGLQLFTMQDYGSLQSSAIASIEVTEMMGADIFRGEEAAVNDLDITINVALAKALEEEFDEAIRILEGLLNEELSDQQFGRVSLNLGILRYNQGAYTRSAYHFQKVIETDALPEFFEEKAWWFMGNAYLNVNQLEEARESVFNAYTMDGRFASPALSLLKKLDLELGRIPADDPAPAQ